ncbi:MAG: branched-chain amino acid ABC transporter substrate-binding protein [Alphaproteobacteria bacterium]|nr:branched-chain amino acid ABC transporter substrate-binding protein [Alphaproteobacteria bacterium]
MRIKAPFVLSLAMALMVVAGPVTAETYKVFVNLPLSGAWSNFGEGMYNSFKLAIDQGNASGVMGGDKLEVVRGDNAGDTAQGATLAVKAGADKKVIGAFCCWTSGIGIATHAIYNRYSLPVILGGSNDHRSTRPFHKSKVVFRNSPYDLINMKMAAVYATKIAKFKRIFAIDDNSAFATTQVNEFSKVAKKAGDVLIGRESIVPGEKDFTPLLTKIKPMNPDLLFFGGRIVEASLIRQQMIKLGLNIPMMSSGGVFSDTYIKITGKASEGFLASFWGLPMANYPEGRGLQFEKDYAAAKFNDPYETFGPMAYAAGQVYVQAVVAAQKKGKVTRKAILKELETGTFKTMIGDFSFDENGMLDILHIAIYRIEDGKWRIKYRTDRKATTLKKIN